MSLLVSRSQAVWSTWAYGNKSHRGVDRRSRSMLTPQHIIEVAVSMTQNFCFGDFLQILPWDSSPFFTTIWGRYLIFFPSTSMVRPEHYAGVASCVSSRGVVPTDGEEQKKKIAQIMATSHDLTPHGRVVGEPPNKWPYFRKI